MARPPRTPFEPFDNDPRGGPTEARELLRDLPCLDERGVGLRSMPSPDSVAFFAALISAARTFSNAGYPRPVDLDGVDPDTWMEWWTSSPDLSSFSDDWAAPLSDDEAAFVDRCARVLGSFWIGVAIQQLKLSDAWSRSWDSGSTMRPTPTEFDPAEFVKRSYPLPERLLDRLRANFNFHEVFSVDPFDEMRIEQTRVPDDPVSALGFVYARGRLAAEAGFGPPRTTRIAKLGENNPWRALRRKLVGSSILGVALGIAPAPDGLVCPLRWSVAWHSGVFPQVVFALPESIRLKLFKASRTLRDSLDFWRILAGTLVVNPAILAKVDERLDEASVLFRFASEPDRTIRELALLALQLRFPLTDVFPVIDTIATLATFDLDMIGTFPFFSVEVENTTAVANPFLAILGLDEASASSLSVALGGPSGRAVAVRSGLLGIAGDVPTTSRNAEDALILVGPSFRAHALASSFTNIDHHSDVQRADPFDVGALEPGYRADRASGIAAATWARYANAGRPIANLMRLLDGTAQLLEYVVQADDALLAANDIVSGSGALVNVVRNLVDNVGASALFDTLGGVSPTSMLRFAIRQALTDLYLGYAENSAETDYDEGCLYPFIPWMDSATKRAHIDEVFGPAQALTVATELNIRNILAAFTGVQAELGMDLDAWRELIRTQAPFLTSMRVRQGWMGLLGLPTTGAPPALQVVRDLVDGQTTLDLAAVGKIEAWTADARRSIFRGEDIRPERFRS